MIVYVIPPTGEPHPKHIEGTLEDLQGLVQGLIEPCAPAELRDQGIELLANEEGLLKGLPCNLNLFPFFYVGTLVAVGVGEEDFISLTFDQYTYLQWWLTTLH